LKEKELKAYLKKNLSWWYDRWTGDLARPAFSKIKESSSYMVCLLVARFIPSRLIIFFKKKQYYFGYLEKWVKLCIKLK
jgi:hypothetical protein